ncbi:MAG TPA: flagellar export chaperone FliS [Candidatus Sulfopaludibacter sp.]|jgi:flagellar protein FliS|nr:flagellar export chaperone FliS [Candidatus Sulfopaludibacter sp.]
MWQNAHDAYLESRITSADPLELVKLLYQACTGSVREARRYLTQGEIAERSRSITKAHEILVELTSSLDHSRGGDLSRRLAELYDYMQRKLLEANLQQTDGPLAEILGLLCTLSEAWDGISSQNSPAECSNNAWSQPVPEPMSTYSTGGWSL